MQACKEQDYSLELSLCSIPKNYLPIFEERKSIIQGPGIHWTLHCTEQVNTLISRAFLIVIRNPAF